MKVNSATTARAGLASGMMTSTKVRSSLAPSIFAASESSMGMVRKNCRRRKMEKALAKNAGTQSGRNVPTHPSQRNSANVGTMITGNGTIIVASVMLKNRSRPGHFRRANE